ncbi:MAG: hypothetical protein MUE67_12005 [Anaerolineales bacterium]|nr:hypothetical protein [Anaerolineales bacterium]
MACGWIGLALLCLVSACSLPLSGEAVRPSPTTNPSPTPVLEAGFPFPAFNTPALPVDQLGPDSTSTPATTPTTIPATQAPQASSDLLFLEDGRLMRWDHVTNYKTPLAEGVVEYSLSQNGRRVALLRSTKVAANGNELFNLDLLDLKNKQVTSLLKSIPRVYHLRASPDGQMIAYQAVNESVIIAAIAIKNPQEEKSIGECRQAELQPCSSLTWSSDGYSLAWKDEDGIWLSKLGQSKPQLLASHQIEVTDPKGLVSSITVSFGDLRWSPKGRFILTRIQTLSGVEWSAILDTRQGHWNEVPDTFNPSGAGGANAAWMPGGEVLVVKTPQQETGKIFAINLWEIMPTGKEFFVMDRQFRISPDHPAFVTNGDFPLTAQQAGWTAVIAEEMLCFSITPNGNTKQLYFFWYELGSNALAFRGYAAENVQSILWSPDGSGALLIQTSGLVEFVRRSQPGTLTLFEPENGLLTLFSWAPPTLRE